MRRFLLALLSDFQPDPHIQPDENQRVPFLSDVYPALVAVCSISRHFLSLRHPIENFDLDSYLGQIVRRLVFSSTEEGFRRETEACAYDLLELRKTGTA
jgi:hypothetical protein